MKKDAVLSEDRRYRYALWRVWDESLPLAMFIGLNPSTADETHDDRTLVRCMNFAKGWGYGGVCMANLFAYRATKPKDMKTVDEPVGKDNDKWLATLAREADIVIAAWGNHGLHRNRATEVRQLVSELNCIQLNSTGEPAHPLFLKSASTPTRMKK